MKKTKRLLGQRQIFQYIKMMGLTPQMNVSPYTVATEALRLDGIATDGYGGRGWVLLNADHIKARVASLKQEKVYAREIERPGPVRIIRSTAPQAAGSFDPNSDAFLQSYEWKRLRMKVLKRYGARCQCCGASPSDGAVMNVDHIKPRRLFPKLALDEDNLQVLCGDCNHGKGNWDQTDWRPEDVDHDQVATLRLIARNG